MSPLALGDFLYLNPFLKALKEAHPQWVIDLWFDDGRGSTETWRLARSRLLTQWMETESTYGKLFGCTASRRELREAIQEASREAYDQILVLNQSKVFHYLQVARAIQPKARVTCAMSRIPWWMPLLRKFLGKPEVLYRPRPLPKDHHISNRYHALVEDLFGITLPPEERMPTLVVPEPHLQQARERLAAAFPRQEGRLILLNARSTNPRRDWRPDQVTDLVSRIASEEAAHFILTAAPEHLAELEALLESWPRSLRDRALPFSAQSHFFELPALMSHADLVISVETAPLHFAFALQKPLIALMRQKKPYWAPPRNGRSWVLQAPAAHGQVGDISVDAVFEAYREQRSRLRDSLPQTFCSS